MDWLKQLEIAIVEKNTNQIDKLLGDMPKFDNNKDRESAMYLLKEAMTLLYQLKDDTVLSMRQLKKSISFLGSTATPKTNKLDIKL